MFGTPKRARVRSLKVLLVAAIPWIGYGAYLVPLRSESQHLSWLLAQHISYRLYDVPFEQSIADRPRFVQRAVGWLLPPLDPGSCPCAAPSALMRCLPS